MCQGKKFQIAKNVLDIMLKPFHGSQMLIQTLDNHI
jgi:hypothetical protein